MQNIQLVQQQQNVQFLFDNRTWMERNCYESSSIWCNSDIFLFVISSMICYSKWFQEEEENTKKFKTNYKLSNNPTVSLLGKIGP